MTLIALEGLDFSGKTSTLERIKPFLNAVFPNIIYTFEPGGIPENASIREKLMNDDLTGIEKLNLFANDRLLHVKNLIAPAILNNRIVITDRYIGSTYAYQVGGDHVPMELVNEKTIELFNKYPMAQPDLTIYFSVPYKVRQQRMQQRNHDKLDDYNELFYMGVQAAYLNGIDKISKKIIIIDASLSPKDLADKLEIEIRNFIQHEKD